jgi:Ricin-type beta-trefoil lectin domain-like
MVHSRLDTKGAHQRWRLVPVGEGGHEYAIMNVHSGKALDLWDGTWRDDAEIVQLGYWHGTQQRWVLTACDAGTVSRAVVTIVRDESVFLPIWLRYYRQFFSAQDMYVLIIRVRMDPRRVMVSYGFRCHTQSMGLVGSATLFSALSMSWLVATMWCCAQMSMRSSRPIPASVASARTSTVSMRTLLPAKGMKFCTVKTLSHRSIPPDPS